MTTQVDEIMRLASLLATARCRRMAVNSPNYRGVENAASTDKRVADATEALRVAVAEALKTKELTS